MIIITCGSSAGAKPTKELIYFPVPRGTGKYISSFVGFAPADEPQVIIIMTVDEPQGIYYGGTIVAPKVKKIFENILPYLNL